MAETSENVVVSDSKPILKASTGDADKNATSGIVDHINKEEKSPEKFNDVLFEKVNKRILSNYPHLNISRLPSKKRNEKNEPGEDKTDNNRNILKGRFEKREVDLIERAQRFTPNLDLLSQIMELGICKNAAINALFFTGNRSIELASNYVLDHPNNADDVSLKDRVLAIAERRRKENLAALEMKNYIVDTAIHNYKTMKNKQAAASKMVHRNPQGAEVLEPGEIHRLHHDGKASTLHKRQYGEMMAGSTGDASALTAHHIQGAYRINDVIVTPQNIEITSIDVEEPEEENNMDMENGDKNSNRKVSLDDYKRVREIDDSEEMEEEIDEEYFGTEYKMVLVVNSEFNMNRKTLTEKTAKATIGLINTIMEIPINSLLGPEEFSMWEDSEQRMDTLKADTGIHLNELELMAEDLDLPNYTSFLLKEGEKPKPAVLALFGSDDVVDQVTGRLKDMDSSD